MSPKPITDYLTDFDRPAPPTAPSAIPAPANDAPANDAPDLDVIRAEAFAAGKEEGLALADARHALERRRAENEADQLSAERIGEMEARLGGFVAERLASEIARLGETLSREAAACLAPFVRTAAERRVVDALAADARKLTDAAHVTVSGPRPMVDALRRALDPSVRERVRVGSEDGPDVRIETDDLVLASRLGELDDAMRAA